MQKDNMRSLAPPINLIDKINIIKPEARVLKNGVPVWLMNGGNQDIIKFELLFNVGSSHQDKPLQAYATANLLKSGTRERSSAEINKLWDFYGVSLQIEPQKDLISVGFFCLTKHFEPVLDLLLEIVTKATFPENELEILLNNRKQKHRVNLQTVQHLARVHFAEMVFGKNHPYGKILKLEDFDKLERDDLVAFHHRYLQPSNCMCFVSGRFPSDTVELINKKFQKHEWPVSTHKKQDLDFPVEPGLKKQHMIMENQLQASLRIGQITINQHHPDYHLASITNTLLGGYFGSRLMRNIRQEKGYTYGINSALVAMLKATYFFITTQVGKEVKDDALHEIYHELRQLRSAKVHDNELAMLRNYVSAGFLRSFDGPFMQMERFREMHLFDLTYDHYEEFLPLLSRVTSWDIQETAEKYFHEENMTELVVG